MRENPHLRGAILATVILPFLATLAPAPAAADELVRSGFIVGFGAGFGHMGADCSQCDSVVASGSVDFHIGGMLGPRLALMADSWLMIHYEDHGSWGVTITHTIGTAAAQFWLLPSLWVKGGLGIARASYSWSTGGVVFYNDHTSLAPAVMGAVGVELVRGRRFAMDAQLRVGSGFYDTDQSRDGYEVRATSVELGLGFNWY